MLYSNRFIILSTQIVHKTQTQNIENIFILTVQYLGKYSSTVKWLASSQQAKRIRLEEEEKMGDDRSKGSSTIGDEGQATISLKPDIDGLGLGFLL